ncbi:transcription initiation factor IIB [Coemansia brasiliensis]|uniref:Transcription initiation factor IIB n=1 Tax=Coemansia brasiliensis TaxID=2650707 RepID=A0A9W8IBS9_9FUNG|nr:transcription initiation factor IIB [Coemansia brasiliensis]
MADMASKSASASMFSVQLICRNCRDDIPHIIEDFSSGELVCGDCGLVLGDRIIDVRSEWRTFADSEGDDPSRVGSAGNPLLDGNQLDTVISRTGGSSELTKYLSRAQKKTSDEPAVQLEGFQTISNISSANDIAKSVENIAKQLYKKAIKEQLLRKRDHDAAIAVCMLYAFRIDGASRTFREICKMTRVKMQEMVRVHKLLRDKFSVDTTSTTSKDLIERLCSKLDLGNDVRKAADSLNATAMELPDISGKNPTTIASACIYMAAINAGCRKSTKDIAHVSGVAETTIRQTYKTLYAHIQQPQA